MHAARRPSATIAIVLLTAHLANPLLSTLAFAQGGTSNVAKGQEYYEQSRFDEAIGLLKDLVDRGALQGEDLQHARELLARSYVKKGYPVQGKEMFKAILRTNPAWRPDPIRVPPDETAVFDQALKEYTSESAGSATPTPGGTPSSTPAPTTTTTPTPTETTSPPAPPPAARPTPAPEATGVPSAESVGGKKSSKKIWYIVGGAVLVGGIAAAAAGGGGGKGSTPKPNLASFPTPPSP